MKHTKITQHQKMKRDELVGYLEDLIKSLKAGKLVIEQNGQFVSLNQKKKIKKEIEKKKKKEKGEISIEISWKIPEEMPDMPPLKISSEEPTAGADSSEAGESQ